MTTRYRTRREDLRRLPLAQQVARVRKYHCDKIRVQGHRGLDDPFIAGDDVAKRFRTICPEGLLRIYAETAKGTRRAAFILLQRETP